MIESAPGIADEIEHDSDRARILFWAADVEITAGDYDRTHALLQEGLRSSPSSASAPALGVAARVMGWFAMQRGDYAGAKVVLQDYIEHSSLNIRTASRSPTATSGWSPSTSISPLPIPISGGRWNSCVSRVSNT